jgi:hypothetical protein
VANQIADELALASECWIDSIAETKQKWNERDDDCISMPSSSEKNSSPTYSNEVNTFECSRLASASGWKKAKTIVGWLWLAKHIL